MAESRSGRDTALWSLGIIVVILFALIPVLWIVSISFKAPASITAGDSLGPSSSRRTGRSRTTRACSKAGSTVPSSRR